MSILRRLDDYRGESRFTTWTWKFALLEAAARTAPPRVAGTGAAAAAGGLGAGRGARVRPPRDAETGELLAAIGDAIRDDLTAHQREVLLALAVDGVPIDVLAERRGTTRGALYKTLHDARRRLRAAARGADLVPPGGPS